MSTSAAQARARSVEIREGRLFVLLVDGREISAPIIWFPRLSRGTSAELARWELIGDGIGIHWPDLDEDISVDGLLHPERTLRSRLSGP